MEIKEGFDTAFDTLYTALSFVTFANTFYVLMVLYVVVASLFTIIYIQKKKSRKAYSGMTSVKVAK